MKIKSKNKRTRKINPLLYSVPFDNYYLVYKSRLFNLYHSLTFKPPLSPSSKICVYIKPQMLFFILISNLLINHSTQSVLVLFKIYEVYYIQNPFSTRSACLKLFVRPNVRMGTFGKNQTIIQCNKLQFCNKNADLANCSSSMITKLINKFLDP